MKMERVYLSGRVLHPDGAIQPGTVVIEDGVIVETTVDERQENGLLIAPGFIDLQINGAFGHDFMAHPASMAAVAQALPRTGVTAFLPTITSAPIADYPRYFAALEDTDGEMGGWGDAGNLPVTASPRLPIKSARILGLHLEGPYLNPARAGAHVPANLRTPVAPAADGLLRPGLALMTLAPEQEGGLAAIRDLTAHGVVVSAGHSAATYEQALAALDAGLTYGTHIFNAMEPLSHRKAGLVSALLSDDRVRIGLIADGVHVHPSTVKWLIRAKGAAGVTLVTDALAPAGMGRGRFQLGRQRIFVTGEGGARLANGTLAGSILTLDQAIRNVVAWGAASLSDALRMASTTPADLLGRADLGRIAPGCAADMVVLDESLHVQRTLVGGQTAATS